MSPASRTVSFGRYRIRVDDDQPTFWDRVEAGAWEPGTLTTLERLVGPDTTFLDLGAWVGPLSLYAAALGARVLAVAADPAALDQLRRNLAANPDLAARVTVVPRAVSSESGPVGFGARRKPGDSMSSTLLTDRATTAWTADAVTPRELAALIEGTSELVLKLDIEGGEYALLPALGPLLDRPKTAAAIVAFHPEMLANSSDMARALGDAARPLAGWRAVRIDKGTEPAAPDVGPGAVGGEWLFLSPSHPGG